MGGEGLCLWGEKRLGELRLCVTTDVLLFLPLLVGTIGVVEQEFWAGWVILDVVLEIVARGQGLSAHGGLTSGQSTNSDGGQQDKPTSETFAGSLHTVSRFWLLLESSDSINK